MHIVALGAPPAGLGIPIPIPLRFNSILFSGIDKSQGYWYNICAVRLCQAVQCSFRTHMIISAEGSVDRSNHGYYNMIRMLSMTYDI